MPETVFGIEESVVTKSENDEGEVKADCYTDHKANRIKKSLRNRCHLHLCSAHYQMAPP